jgi:hypothetical protein
MSAPRSSRRWDAGPDRAWCRSRSPGTCRPASHPCHDLSRPGAHRARGDDAARHQHARHHLRR